MGGKRKPKTVLGKTVLGKLEQVKSSGNGKPEKAPKSGSSEDDSDDRNDGEKLKGEEIFQSCSRRKRS